MPAAWSALPSNDALSKPRVFFIGWYCNLWQAGILVLHCFLRKVACHKQALPVDPRQQRGQHRPQGEPPPTARKCKCGGTVTSDKQGSWCSTAVLCLLPVTCHSCRGIPAGSLVSIAPRESPSARHEMSIWWYCSACNGCRESLSWFVVCTLLLGLLCTTFHTPRSVPPPTNDVPAQCWVVSYTTHLQQRTHQPHGLLSPRRQTPAPR